MGELQIGIVDNTLTNPACRLATAIGRFKAGAADVHVTLHVLAPTELEQAVLDQRLPAAIGAFHHHVAGLSYAPLFVEEQTLYCGSGHPFFRCADEAIPLADIAGGAFLEDLQAAHATVAARPTKASAPRRQRPRKAASRALSRAAAAS